MIGVSIIIGLLLGFLGHEIYIKIYEPYKYRHFDINKYIKDNSIISTAGNRKIFNIDVSKLPNNSLYLMEILLKEVRKGKLGDRCLQ